MSTLDEVDEAAPAEPAPPAAGARAAILRHRRWLSIGGGLLVVVVSLLVVRACRAPDAGAEAFCAQVQRVRAITTAEQLQGRGGQATLAELRTELDQLRVRSPGAVRGDVATLADVTRRLQDALDRQDRGSRAERDKATAELDAGLDAFERASTRVVDYAQRTCGLDLDG